MGYNATVAPSMPLLLNLSWLNRGAQQGCDRAAQTILTAARGNAPVDTGTLRDSGHLEHAGDPDYTASASEPGVDIVFDAADPRGHHYAAWVELGTSRAPAQPFLLPAAEGHGASGLRADINDAVGEEVA